MVRAGVEFAERLRVSLHEFHTVTVLFFGSQKFAVTNEGLWCVDLTTCFASRGLSRERARNYSPSLAVRSQQPGGDLAL